MDEAAAAATREDEAEEKPHNGHTASHNNVASSAEDRTDIKQCLACEDCGLTFTDSELFNSHLHQHALEEIEEEEEDDETAEPDFGRGDDGEDADEDTGGDTSSSSQTNSSVSTPGAGDAAASANNRPQVYACLVCGKVYRYLVSFRKHQRLHENQPSTTQSVQSVHKYECPDCGMSFMRRVRLLSHLRIHRSFRSKPPRCDQCNKGFSSRKSWMAHVDLHKRKPFWCLSCAKGFGDERSLEKHMQSHNLRPHSGNSGNKSFHVSAQLRNYYSLQTGAKPYQCTFCGKNFSHLGNLILHRKKKHLRVYVGPSGMPLGMKKRVIRKKRLLLSGVEEEPGMDTNTGGEENHLKGRQSQKPHEDAETADHLKLSVAAGWAGSDPPVEPRRGQELDESESQETKVPMKPVYWEWECCECDMGFDKVEKLHLHYIKHATGELPMSG